jgi:hypothetical protein
MDLQVDLTAISVVTVIFLTSAIIVATVLLFLHRAKELKHATIRLALEKGLPLPTALLEETPPAPRPSNDLNSGVKLLFIGVGIGLFFYFLGHPRLWAAGFIPGFVGVGYLAAHALTGRKQPGAPTAG